MQYERTHADAIAHGHTYTTANRYPYPHACPYCNAYPHAHAKTDRNSHAITDAHATLRCGLGEPCKRPLARAGQAGAGVGGPIASVGR